jgi:hypothetical protein
VAGLSTADRDLYGMRRRHGLRQTRSNNYPKNVEKDVEAAERGISPRIPLTIGFAKPIPPQLMRDVIVHNLSCLPLPKTNETTSPTRET